MREVVHDLEHELAELSRLVERVEKWLTSDATWNDVGTTFAASQVHSFYGGVERCLLLLTDPQSKPRHSGGWHTELLRTFEHEDAFPYHDLRVLLAFRHFYRNSYAVFLDPIKVEVVVETLISCWPALSQWLGERLRGLQAP